MKRWRKLKIVSRVQQREPLTLLSCFVRSDVNAGAAWQGVTVFLLHILLLLVRLAPSPSSNNLCVLLRCCRWRTIIYYNVNILIHARVRIFCTVYMCTFMIMGWQCCLIKIRWIRAIRKHTHTHFQHERMQTPAIFLSSKRIHLAKWKNMDFGSDGLKLSKMAREL